MYLFALSMVRKNTTTSNIWIFEDLNIGQLGLNKDYSHFGELLILW